MIDVEDVVPQQVHGPGGDDAGVYYSIDEALSAAEFGRFQYSVLAYAGLGYLMDAMEVMLLSFIGPSVKSLWGLSAAEEGLITTVVFAGMLIGAYSWGVFSDNFGRRKTMLSIAIVTTIFALLSSFSPNYTSLLVLRALVGTGLGGGSVYLCWFLEFVPPKNRGMWMVIFSTFWTVGTILEAILAWVVMPGLGWRWLLVLSSLPSFAAVAFYGFSVESPRYLCTIGRIKDAHSILQRIAEVNQTKLPVGMLVCEQMTVVNQEALLPKQNNSYARYKAGFSSLFSIFSSSLIGTTLLIWVQYFGNAFLYYGVVLMTSELSSDQTSCMSTISDSNDGSSLYRDVFFTSLAEVPGLILAAVLVDKIGRKFSMVFMYALGFLFLLPLVLQQDEALTTLLLSGARMCFLGTFTITVIYCPEIYPTSVRTTGSGVANAVGRIAGMICPIVAVQFISGCEIMAAILLFEVIAVVSGLCVLLFRTETKGQQLSDTVVAS
ncbi:organic cation/carnitine transporter 7-like [Ipomoea triloba]|uniref:organic cation/carnitine transporter 7-like n=1 Tax=Ipomoea triloba TaxID=35885 RepID=UPI00125E5ACE|nr:organic cation/carnitine transporter 7-like [Ipomoea triloba]